MRSAAFIEKMYFTEWSIGFLYLTLRIVCGIFIQKKQNELSVKIVFDWRESHGNEYR